MAETSSPSELRLVREYDAPVDIVWDAWTDPEQVAKWWGPRGFTLTTHSKDLRPGGHWHYTMHGPDGTDYENRAVYYEVVEPSATVTGKLVYDHGGSHDRPALFKVTALFSETDGKTTLDMTMAFESPEKTVEMRKFIKEAGGESTWDRLAEYLEKESTGAERFVINRSFVAPADVVFSMWTDPEHFARWLPPAGFEMEFLRADIRPGGTTFYRLWNGEGVEMYGRAAYQEITPVADSQGRLVYTQEFCDADENLSRHPFAPLLPATMQTTVTIVDEGAGHTRVTVEWEPVGDVTPEELAAFAEARGGMTQGWTGSFDKLEAILEAA